MPPTPVGSWSHDLLASPAAIRLGWVCIHSLWQGLAVAAMLAVALRIVPRGSPGAVQARYWLAVAALLSLPLVAAATWLRTSGGMTIGQGGAMRSALVADRSGADRPATPPTDPASVVARSTAVLQVNMRAASRAIASSLVSQFAPWLPAVAAAWLAGMVLAATRTAAGFLLTDRLVTDAVDVGDRRLQASVVRWRRAFGIERAVRVVASAAIDAPMVVGWLRPVVVWPLAAATGTPCQELDAIVAHELAHIRRGDLLVNLLQAGIDVLFFHHPAAWWISAQVRAEREHCADDLAVRMLETQGAGTRLSYARALVSLEERRLAGSLAVAASGGRLGDRIRRLAGVDERPSPPLRLATAGLAFAAVAIVVIGGPEGGGVPTPAVAAAPAAAELPADTNTIRSLTPEQARELVEKFQVMDPVFPKLDRCLPLDGLRTVDVETATALARFQGNHLSLRGLTTLSTDVAAALAEFRGHQSMGKGYLSLDGLTSLSPQAAGALSRFQGHVLSLGLTELSADTLQAIAACRVDHMVLDRLAKLSADEAAHLARLQCGVSLGGLTTLSPEAAEQLAAGSFRHLAVEGLTDLSGDTAGWLVRSKGWNGVLNRLTTLDADAAAALATFPGQNLSIGGPTELSPEAAAAIARYRGINLYLNGLKTISADVAAALAGFRGMRLDLSGVASLDAEAAGALAAFEGKLLVLNCLRRLDAEAARALAAFAGEGLDLSFFSTKDPEVVAALAAFKGRKLSVDPFRDVGGKTPLTPGWARAVRSFVEGRKTGVVLSAVTAFETPEAVETAGILAATKGGLSLPNLAKISPKTLTALIAKEDVEIPLIETLELIEEPDGSATEDFVIPEGFEQKKQRR